MADIESILSMLHAFKLDHLDIPCLTQSAADFDEIRSIYAHPEIVPLAIIRPATLEDVQSVVRFLSSNGIEFTIRAGGHDMHGRSMKQDAIVLDMRLIKNVTINPPPDQDVATATVGGGILIGNLISRLQSHGYVTPVGSVPSVGYVGWAMYGGYGGYSAHFGLGVDQFVGARIVNVHGELIEADTELLKGIRGAGGAFGVIVEMTVRIYKVHRVCAPNIPSPRGFQLAQWLDPCWYDYVSIG